MSIVKQEGYVVLTQTVCNGAIVAYKDENCLPVFYRTYHEAKSEIAEDMMEQLDQFMKGERDEDCTCFDGTQDFVGYAFIYDDDKLMVYNQPDTALADTFCFIETTLKKYLESV